jgi:hypothetical protein
LFYFFIILEEIRKPNPAPDQDWIPVTVLLEKLHFALNQSQHSDNNICLDPQKYIWRILSEICIKDIKSSINKSKKILSSINTELSLNTTKLPSFSIDKSELFFGALIERVSNSYDLYITTFLINLQLVDINSKIENDKKSIMKWSKVFMNFKGTYDGMRKDKFYCKIRNTFDGKSYLVEGKITFICFFIYEYRYVFA